MRPRSIAVSTATLIAAASMTPLTAHAAGQATLYVNGSSSACTDSGSGTLAAPYCSIQAAADAAGPGDTVNVAPGAAYAAFTVTKSGTASDPIVFTGNGVENGNTVQDAAGVYGVEVSGASYVDIENFSVLSEAGGSDTTVDGGADVSFIDDVLNSSASTVDAVHVTGSASAVTVQDSNVDGTIAVDDGSAGTIITTNVFRNELAAAISSSVSITGASDTAVTSNTISGCGPSVSVSESSSGTSIENNLIHGADTSASGGNCPASSQPFGIDVDASSAASTTADYNDVDVIATSTDYDWAGVPYATGAALHAATGQGQHDYNSAMSLVVEEQSPLINSANSAAIGEQPVDIAGDPRVDDPLVTPTGAGPYDYYDRGATQFQDPVTPVTTAFAIPSEVPAGATFTVHAAMTDTWSDDLVYEFFLNGKAFATDSDGTATTSLPTIGSYSIEVAARPANATTPSVIQDLEVVSAVAPAPLTPQISLGGNNARGVDVSDAGTTDAWNITGVTFNFGDGTPSVSTTDGTTVAHTYATAGTYKITETVTDSGGNTATTSSSFSTSAPAPGTLVDFDLANGSQIPTVDDPPGSTGIAQAAITAMPNGTKQVAAVTTAGAVELNILNTNGSWQGWTTLSQPGVTAKSVSIAGMPNGSSQIIEVTSTGVLKHNIRNANGSWQAGGWGSPAGSTGITQAAITAMPDGSSQLVAVTTSGTVDHNIRFTNGSWQGWRSLSQPGVQVTDASIAGMPNGSSQIIEVTSTGVLKHNIRNANGSWQAGGWGSPAGSTGFKQAAIAAQPNGSSAIMAVAANGSFEVNVRYSNGSWEGWYGVNIDQIGSVSGLDPVGMPDDSIQAIAVAAG